MEFTWWTSKGKAFQTDTSICKGPESTVPEKWKKVISMWRQEQWEWERPTWVKTRRKKKHFQKRSRLNKSVFTEEDRLHQAQKTDGIEGHKVLILRELPKRKGCYNRIILGERFQPWQESATDLQRLGSGHQNANTTSPSIWNLAVEGTQDICVCWKYKL